MPARLAVTLFFIVNLSQSQNPALLYGPYLQMGGQTSMVVSWRTTSNCDSKVLFGTAKTNLNQAIQNLTPVTIHTVAVAGLNPNTKYWYTVQNAALSFTCDTFFFYTAPSPLSNQKVRFVVTGDCGTGQTAQVAMRDALMYYLNGKYVNGWLLVGDNAYYNGLDNEYTSYFFTPYQANFLMHHTCLYPATGNHDYANNGILAENKMIPYFDLFNCPAAGELGGLASNTEAYYSYNYGNVHLISIDSYGTEQSLKVYDTLSPQWQWLRQDLAANNSMWTIVYFHHPPYSMGSHNTDVETDLVSMRQYCTPLFEKYKVDLVLSGHSHNYERSWLMKGHQGMENTYSKALHAKDSSSARYDGSPNSCPYVKDTITNKGVIYAVCGSSGWGVGATQATYPHNAMYYSNSTLGMAGYIEAEANKLSAYFVGTDSSVHDRFTIFKNVRKNKTIWATSGQTYTLNASWNGNYVWNYNAAKTRQNTFTAFTNTMLVVRDSLNCIADTFHVKLGTGLVENSMEEWRLFPNPVGENQVQLKGSDLQGIENAELYSMEGKAVAKLVFQYSRESVSLTIPDLPGGIYLLKLHFSNSVMERKIIIEK